MRHKNTAIAILCFIVFILMLRLAPVEAKEYESFIFKGKELLNEKKYLEGASYLKKALFINPSDPMTNFELGVYYYNQQIYAEAIDYFESTLQLAPKSSYAAEAARYLRQISDSTIKKKAYIDIAVGLQYDSNVILNPTGSPLPSDISRKSGWKGIVFLRGNLNLVQTNSTAISVGNNFYQSLHDRLKNFNITLNELDITLQHTFTPSIKGKVFYNFEYVAIGGDEYNTANSATPSLIFTYGNGSATEFYYSYKYTNLKNAEQFPDNSDRSGSNNSIGITQTLLLGGNSKAEIGYMFDKDITKQQYWNYAGHKVFASLIARLSPQLTTNLYAEYYQKNYKGVDPSEGISRKDKTQTYSVSLTKLIGERADVSIAETYINNYSTIGSYDYKRYLTTLLIHMRF